MAEQRVELLEFLERDEKYNWTFTNEVIRNQHRSLSLDQCVPYEGGSEDS